MQQLFSLLMHIQQIICFESKSYKYKFVNSFARNVELYSLLENEECCLPRGFVVRVAKQTIFTVGSITFIFLVFLTGINKLTSSCCFTFRTTPQSCQKQSKLSSHRSNTKIHHRYYLQTTRIPLYILRFIQSEKRRNANHAENCN